jgi:hypothetical protein
MNDGLPSSGLPYMTVFPNNLFRSFSVKQIDEICTDMKRIQYSEIFSNKLLNEMTKIVKQGKNLHLLNDILNSRKILQLNINIHNIIRVFITSVIAFYIINRKNMKPEMIEVFEGIRNLYLWVLINIQRGMYEMQETVRDTSGFDVEFYAITKQSYRTTKEKFLERISILDEDFDRNEKILPIIKRCSTKPLLFLLNILKIFDKRLVKISVEMLQFVKDVEKVPRTESMDNQLENTRSQLYILLVLTESMIETIRAIRKKQLKKLNKLKESNIGDVKYILNGLIDQVLHPNKPYKSPRDKYYRNAFQKPKRTSK